MKIEWNKILSGRFILTLCIGLLLKFGWYGKIEVLKKLKEIILVIVYGYFTRGDRKQENGGNSHGSNIVDKGINKPSDIEV